MNRRKKAPGDFPCQLTEKILEDELHTYTEQLEKYGDVLGRDYTVVFGHDDSEEGGRSARPYGIVYTKGTRLNKEGVI